MTEVIVDTNVAIVANGQNTDVVAACADACKRFIASVATGRVVVIDNDDAVRREYADNIRMGRPYQLGSQFLLHVIQNQYNERYVRRIDLSKRSDGEFADFPTTAELTNFDRSDRKFAAMARKTGTPVTNATDSDWADFRDVLHTHGIAVDFLCGCRKDDWFNKPRRIARPRSKR